MSIVLNNFHKKLFDCNNEIKKKSQRYRDWHHIWIHGKKKKWSINYKQFYP